MGRLIDGLRMRMKAAAQSSDASRPPRAVVGSQVSFEEEMFGARLQRAGGAPLLVLRGPPPTAPLDRRGRGAGVHPHPDRDSTRAALRHRRRARGRHRPVSRCSTGSSSPSSRWRRSTTRPTSPRSSSWDGSPGACSSISAGRCTRTCSTSPSPSWTGPRWAGSCPGSRATSTRCRSSSRPRSSRSAISSSSSASSPFCCSSTCASVCSPCRWSRC